MCGVSEHQVQTRSGGATGDLARVTCETCLGQAGIETRHVDLCQVCGSEIAYDADGCEDHPGAPILPAELLPVHIVYDTEPPAPIVPSHPSDAEARAQCLQGMLDYERRRASELQRRLDAAMVRLRGAEVVL